jgi:hypothetical protein
MSTITTALFNLISDAIRLRAIGAGASTFADQTWAYDSGTITSAVDNLDGTVTVGDSTKAWMTSPHHRWIDPVAGADGVPSWDWGSFDLVVEAPDPDYTPDPRKVLQAHITAQPDATHVTVSLNPTARIAEGRLAAVGDVVGRRYWILRANGSNWTRGYMDQPNDPAIAFGRVVAVDVSSGTSTVLTSTRKIDDVVAGNEVIYRDSGDVMRRKVVTAVDYAAQTITWSGVTNPPVVEITPPLREFYVVAAGGVWVWGAQGGTANTAYSGLRGENYLGHDTDDTVGAAHLPTLTYDFIYGTDPLSCPLPGTGTTHIFNSPTDDGRDIDLYYPQDNACGTRDTFINERMHKSIRAWWSDLMQICTGYIPNQSYDGSTAIPNFTIATWLYTAGVNPHAGTVGTHTGTSMPCALGVPHTPITLWWTIRDTDGSDLISGYEANYDGATINGTFSAVHDGKPVYASTGPTRPVPKRFGRMFDVVYFVPDVDSGSAQTPPSNTFPGTWTIRPKSTHYRIADANHAVGDSSLSRHAIANGDYARYVGDNLDDPGFPVTLSADVAQPLADYHNNAYVGTRARVTQNAIDGSSSGTATGGSSRRIVDAARDWDAVDFMPRTNGLTHTFTASSGSTTGCTVPSVSGTALWASGRFPGFSGPFVGFCAEFITNGGALVDPTDFDDPDAVIEKRLIISGTTAGAITWAEATSVSVNGCAGRIVEPFVLNPRKGRPVVLNNPDGTSATVVIEGSHGDTLFIPDPDIDVGAGTGYGIVEPEMSGVFHRVSGAWVSTADAGADPRYTATAAVFRKRARNNIEDTFTEYGLYRPNDQPFTEACFAEIIAAVNALDMIAVGGGWIDSTGNKREAGWHNESTYSLWQSGVTSGGASRTPPDGSTSYYPYNGPVDGSGAPFAVWDAWVLGQYLPPTPSWQVTSGFVGDVRRQFNHFQVTLPDNVYAKSVAFYNFADDPDTLGPSSTWNTTSVDFDANSDPVARRVWTMWSTDSGTTGTVTSSQLGSLTIPNAATAPDISALPAATVPQTGTSTHILGYKVTAAIATISYGFPALTL